MPSTPQEIPLTFEKGLVTEVEDSVLDEGQASELVNWEPSPNGSLRVRNAYTSMTTSGLTAPYRTRGFGAIATGGSAAGSGGAQVVQTARWPDGANDEMLMTKTQTLTGCTIGNVLVAVAMDDSNLTPTVTGGWTQRAVSVAEDQWVKFYTKTAASSTEAFTYTITSARLRELTLYELANVDAEDPGISWAAVYHGVGSGTDTLTVNASDVEGGIAIVGYLYDGGTPGTGGSGTSGYVGSTVDDSNSRTGLSITDLDQLDTGIRSTNADFVTPSWTPPTTGTVLCIFHGTAGTSCSLTSVTGNGLTWSAPVAVGNSGPTSGAYYSWADLTPGSTPGSITIDVQGTGMIWWAGTFVHLLGCPAGVDPVQQSIYDNSFTSAGEPILPLNLQPGAGMLGGAANLSAGATLSPRAGAQDWPSAVPLDSYTGNDAGGVLRNVQLAKRDSQTDVTATSPAWDAVGGSLNGWVMELKGTGTASQARHGTFTDDGTVIENFSYVARDFVAKMVVWNADPTPVSSAAITFYITLAVAVGSTTYKVYRILRDEITTGTWELIDAIDDASGNDAFVSFAQGAGSLVWTAISLTAPRSIALAGLTAANVSDLAGRAGRAAVYHKDRMFIAGAENSPSRVYFSQIGEPTEFVTATDFLDIGGDDGEAVQDLVSVEGLLLVPKTNRSYLISGSGIESFFVNELPGGTAAAGRPAQRTPYGTLLAGDDDIWVVQGGGVDPMSRPLGGEYAAVGTITTAYAQDMCLIADAGTGNVWRLNLVTGAWSLENTRATGGDVYTLFSLNGRIYYGTNDSSTQVGGTRKLSDARDYDATTGGMDLRAATGRLSLVGPGAAYTPRYIYLQFRSQDVAFPNVLTLNIETDLGSRDFVFNVTKTTQRETRALGFTKGATWIKCTFTAASSATAAAIDVERAVLAVDSEAR